MLTFTLTGGDTLNALTWDTPATNNHVTNEKQTVGRNG